MNSSSTSTPATATTTTTVVSSSPSTLTSSDFGKKTIKPKHSMSFNERTAIQRKCSKDVKKLIKGKFKESKGYVDADLVKFTQDMANLREKNKESNPQWLETVEYLSSIANQCAKMTVDEFWFKCTSIVEELDTRRQEHPNGTLKRAHTSLLFILTRCTRLVQFLKEDNDHCQQFWFLNGDNFRGL